MIRQGMLLVLAAGGAAGCLSLKPQPDPTRFYVLSATVAEPPSREPGSVGVGPVELPGYLRHKQLVTRYGDNRVALAESSRWAESLEPMVGRVLREDLASAIGSERSLEYPWPRNLEPSPVVEVQFDRFERDSAGSALLDARWRVRQGDLMRTGRTTLTERAATGSNDDAVAALSRALGRLAGEIAGASKELAAGR
jgi:uncharacterized lipoprotein YmbA